MSSNPFNNIIFVTLDGYRKDKLDICPFLQSYVSSSIFFTNMITVSPYTLAAHHAIFSGMYPSRNGVNAYYNMFKFKKNEITTLPEILKEQGYYTCCDIINDVVIPTKGFDEIKIFDEKTVNFKKRHSELIRSLSKKDKFFLFLHYTEPHKTYVIDIIQKYKDKQNKDEYFNSKEDNDKRYSSYMPELDQYVSEIISTIKSSGISDKTTVIFQADHGTAVGEMDGEMFYGVFVYDYTSNVFSSIHIPNHKPKVISTQCTVLDLFPTIAEMASFPENKIDPKVQGKSLFPIINGVEKEEREAFIETGGLYGPWPSPKKHNVFGIRSNGKKLIYNDTPETWEFYDLINDPQELKNIYDKNSEEVKKLKTRLYFYLKENNIDTKLDF